MSDSYGGEKRRAFQRLQGELPALMDKIPGFDPFEASYTIKELVEDDCYGLIRSSLCKGYPSDIDTVIDIGANVGLFSFLAEPILTSNVRCYCFEPCKRNFIKLLAVAGHLSVSCEHSMFCEPIGLGNESILVFSPIAEGTCVQAGATTVDNPDKAFGAPLSYLCRHAVLKNRSTFIKIDCEGGEKSLLEREEENISIFKDAAGFGVEIHPKIIGKEACDALVTMLSKTSRHISVTEHHACVIVRSTPDDRR